MKYKAANINFPNISAIGIGHMGVDKSNISDLERIKILKYALDCGMNFIDTAENYGHGKSEEIIGKTISKSDRDKFYISTKVSPENLTYDAVIKSCTDSLKRLQTDYIDIYQIHWPNPEVELSETFDALNKLQQLGMIKHIGVSNFSHWLYCEAKQYAKIDVVQLEHNAFTQIDFLYTYDDVLTIGYSPLYMPIEYKNKFNVLQIIAKKYKVTIQQILLNWISNANNKLIPIFRSNNVTNIYNNSKSLDFDIDEIDRELLGTILRENHQYVPMKYIKITPYGKEDSDFYQTVEDAIENRFGLYPSPSMLANDMIKNGGNLIKPIKIKEENTMQSKYFYELSEGRARFWANMIYHNADTDKLISAIII